MKKIFRYSRAMRLARSGRDAYNAAVYSCANVSRVNKSLAFVIRTGPFGYPCVEQIPRPDVVVIAENDKCVIIKDGNIYEMQTWL